LVFTGFLVLYAIRKVCLNPLGIYVQVINALTHIEIRLRRQILLRAKGVSTKTLRSVAQLLTELGYLEKDTEGCSSVYTKVITYQQQRWRFFFDDRQQVGTLKIQKLDT